MKVIIYLLSLLLVLVAIDLSSNVCYVTLTDRNGEHSILTGERDYYESL